MIRAHIILGVVLLMLFPIVPTLPRISYQDAHAATVLASQPPAPALPSPKQPPLVNPTSTGGFTTLSQLNLGSFQTQIHETKLYLLTGNAASPQPDVRLHVFDISDPTTPIPRASYGPGKLDGMDVVGSFAYLADSTQGFIIVDVSNPDNLVRRGTLPFQYSLTGLLRVCNGIAYVVEKGFFSTTSLGINDANVPERIALVDVSDVDHPQRIGVTPILGQELSDIACVGTTIYVGSIGIKIVDVSNPAQPSIVGNYNLTETISSSSVPSRSRSYEHIQKSYRRRCGSR
jgi:hypothetical protein